VESHQLNPSYLTQLSYVTGSVEAKIYRLKLSTFTALGIFGTLLVFSVATINDTSGNTGSVPTFLKR